MKSYVTNCLKCADLANVKGATKQNEIRLDGNFEKV